MLFGRYCNVRNMRVLELCAGAGGQALGLDQAGYEATALVEIETHACETLSLNRPRWNVIQGDLKQLTNHNFGKVDLICGGVPCQPFSIAGQQLGQNDERDLFPVAINIVRNHRPLGFFFENVRGLSGKTFEAYRNSLMNELVDMGYHVEWKVLEAADYGVPQLRPRFIMVGKRNGATPFPWPTPDPKKLTVAAAISDLMNEKKWVGLKEWKIKASDIAPTLVGGSKKHGGPDLGPTRAKRQWAELGVDGMGIANEAPERDFIGMPRLTNRMAARVQGFPDEWQFAGKKTATYRQIGNAFPPPVARAVATAMKDWLATSSRVKPRFVPTQLTLI
jgi:DNA (cytosine-5)-methyltransferase 1